MGQKLCSSLGNSEPYILEESMHSEHKSSSANSNDVITPIDSSPIISNTNNKSDILSKGNSNNGSKVDSPDNNTKNETTKRHIQKVSEVKKSEPVVNVPSKRNLVEDPTKLRIKLLPHEHTLFCERKVIS
jgi:hypothetical protein